MVGWDDIVLLVASVGFVGVVSAADGGLCRGIEPSKVEASVEFGIGLLWNDRSL